MENVFIAGEFRQPTDVAVCPRTGRVAVADPGNRRVQLFDAGFAHLKDIQTNGNGHSLKWPSRVFINNAGEILVIDRDANVVLVYDEIGTYSRLVPGTCHRPRGVSTDQDANVCIVQPDSYCVSVLDSTGAIVRTIGCEGTGPGQFTHKPLYIAVKNDIIYVSDYNGRVHQFIKRGFFIKQFGLGLVCSARGIAITDTDDLVIVDNKGPVTLLRKDIVTHRLGECGKEPWQLNNPRGVAVSKSGQIIIANYRNHNVLVYDVVTTSNMN